MNADKQTRMEISLIKSKAVLFRDSLEACPQNELFLIPFHFSVFRLS
jgi:hypothetical protein